MHYLLGRDKQTSIVHLGETPTFQMKEHCDAELMTSCSLLDEPMRDRWETISSRASIEKKRLFVACVKMKDDEEMSLRFAVIHMVRKVISDKGGLF